MSRAAFFAVPVVVAFAALAALAACGGSIAQDAGSDSGAWPIAPGHGTPTDGGPGKPSPSPVDAGPAGPVITSDTTIVLTLDGGFTAQGTDTSACIVEHEVYAYDFSDGALKWERCVIADGGARNDLLSGSTFLSASQKDALNAALAKVRVIGIVSTCASDLPEETLELSSPEGFAPEIFYDQFTRCGDRSITHVTGLDAVESTLHDAAQ